jgi:TMEM175 potassium channel family protein
MVLGLRRPPGTNLAAVRVVLPSIVAYALSFAYLAIYWNNHHHMFQVIESVNGAILWANMHLLFWLSLVPFITGWVAAAHGAPLPTAAYGVVLLLSAAAYTILEGRIIAHQGERSRFAEARGDARKERLSLALYVSAVPLAFLRPWIADLLYLTVALIWLVPDRRIEAHLERQQRA